MQSDVWEDIVLGSNKNGGKLSGANYVEAIYLEFTISDSFPGDKYLGVIINGQLFCEAIVWASIFLGGAGVGQLSWGGQIILFPETYVGLFFSTCVKFMWKQPINLWLPVP